MLHLFLPTENESSMRAGISHCHRFISSIVEQQYPACVKPSLNLLHEQTNLSIKTLPMVIKMTEISSLLIYLPISQPWTLPII